MLFWRTENQLNYLFIGYLLIYVVEYIQYKTSGRLHGFYRLS